MRELNCFSTPSEPGLFSSVLHQPPPPHVSGLLLLCSAIFQDCRAGVLTNHHEAQK